MKSLRFIRILYSVSAAYDGLLGLVFLVAGPSVFSALSITPPNHWGYVHFPAAILVIFGYMFLRIAIDPVGNRNLPAYGVLLKIAYVGTVAWHTFNGGVPPVWKALAVADGAFALLFIWSIKLLKDEVTS